MTPQEKAKELVDKFTIEIGSSDFHLPEFITGVKCADGSEEYTKLLNEETESLAKQCALIAADEIMEEIRDFCDDNFHQERVNYWSTVKEEITKL